MEVALMADTFSLTQHLLITDSLLTSFSITFPIDALAPPPVRSRSSCRTAARRTLKRPRRMRRRSKTPDDGSFFGGDDIYGFFGGGDGSDGGGSGGFGGGGGGGGGGGFNWSDEWSSSSSYPSDPAFDFVYEVVCWIVFSNCLHFAFKKVVRLMADRAKVVPV